MEQEIIHCKFDSRSLIGLLLSKHYARGMNIDDLINYILENQIDNQIDFGVINNNDYEKCLELYKEGKLIKE